MAKSITAQEVARHNDPSDCWILINGTVYDLTSFAPSHPGGAGVIHKWAGKDGSEEYNMYHPADLIVKTLSSAEKLGQFDTSSVTQAWIDAQRVQSGPTSDQQKDKPALSTLINLKDFEDAFAKHASPKALVYVSDAANDLITLKANEAFWQKIWFRPRVMQNVSKVNAANVKMAGCNVRQPVWICPMGIAKIAGPQGEWALGAGAASSGIIHCMSTASSMSIEDILASVPPTYPYFFQLYVDKQRHKTMEILTKLEAYKNVEAIFITADLATMSKREADERMNVEEASASGRNAGGLARSTGSFIDSALCWGDLAWIRKYTTKKIFIKGIQTVHDAKQAHENGCDGIVVSNHGGRAMDNASPSILVLLEMRRDCPELFDKMEIHIDGGVRRGSDVLKAVLLGARGVGVGRPFQCAVMYNKEGVEAVAEILRDELEMAMRLCGITDLNAVRGDMSYLNTSELERLLPPPPQRWLKL